MTTDVPEKGERPATSHRERYGKAQQYLRETAITCRDDDCLIWPFYRDKMGYGKIKLGGKAVLAHRVVCALAHGLPPSPKHHAAHLCGNGHLGCVNPRHLRWKTLRENKADEILHGTRNRGERNGQSRITSADVKAIRRLGKTADHQMIALQFGISSNHVSGILKNKVWRHVT